MDIFQDCRTYPASASETQLLDTLARTLAKVQHHATGVDELDEPAKAHVLSNALTVLDSLRPYLALLPGPRPKQHVGPGTEPKLDIPDMMAQAYGRSSP